MKKSNVVKLFNVFSLTGRYFWRSYFNNKDGVIVELKYAWSRELLELFNIEVELIGLPQNKNVPCILVGNHISYLDIPLLMYFCPSITFVGKKEIKYWPVIGAAAKKAGTIFVERGKRHSRALAKKHIAQSLLENNQQVAIFPSGTTSLYRSAFWKKGAFEIAQNNNIKLQPFRLRYYPQSNVAYVGKDNFLIHMLQLFRLSKIKVVVEFHHPVNIYNSEADCFSWKNWCEGLC